MFAKSSFFKVALFTGALAGSLLLTSMWLSAMVSTYGQQTELTRLSFMVNDIDEAYALSVNCEGSGQYCALGTTDSQRLAIYKYELKNAPDMQSDIGQALAAELM